MVKSKIKRDLAYVRAQDGIVLSEQKTPVYSFIPVLKGSLVCLLLLSITAKANDVVKDLSGPKIPNDVANSSGDKLQLLDDEIISEELFLFQDLPVVVSATRREQPINESSVSISVITADDIRASGQTNLYEVLQFQPGVDMLQIDRNRYALGVRGLHEFFSDRTLTLIDGRNADSPVFGGSEFLRLPLFLDDIEQIEIVRGPGGAAWGAQAFNGVINIITKDPQDVHGTMITGTINEFGDHYSQIRWADGVDKWDWRLSLGYNEWESSDEAVGAILDFPLGGSAASRDFHRNTRFDGKAIYRITNDSKLSFGLGTSYVEQGDFEVTGSFAEDNSYLKTIRAFTRFDHSFDNDGMGYIQWFGNYAESEWPELQTNDSLENDVEIQYNFKVGGSHSMTVGGNIRFVRITTDQKSEEDIIFDDESLTEGWGGMFAIDRWQATKRLVVETQIRGDYYSETHPDWSGRLTSQYSIDDEKHHVLRLSSARAFRAPLAALREIRSNREPLSSFSPLFPPDIFATSVVSPDDLDNEGILSVELGYSGQINKLMVLNLNTYYQHYDDLIGFSTIAETGFVTPIGTVSSTTLTVENIDSAEAIGAEVELIASTKLGSLSLWYAYNEFDPSSSEGVRAFLPARNKAGVNGRVRLPWKSTLNVGYKYTDVTRNNPGALLLAPDLFDLSHRLDITVAKQFFDDRIGWLIGVSDVFDETDIRVSGITNVTTHDTPGRFYFTRISVSF